jgi:nucleoid-associated protein EbfC
VNINQLMKQAQSMQKKVAEMQEKVEKMEIIGSSGGGVVAVTMNGKGEAKSLKIDKSLIVPDDAEILEDLVVAAINDAKAKIDDQMNSEMSGIGGLPPGFKLPF